MKKIIYPIATLLLITGFAKGQETVYPTKEYKGRFYITNGTVHIGNGQVLDKATIEVNNGKISQIGTGISVSGENARVYDAKGKQVYPGLILPVTDVGLKEIANGVRGSNDYQELGEYNSNVRSIVAYNTDSKIIATLRANGILLANIAPEGGIISGSSSVVQLDAWNWEDASYKQDAGIHLNLPSFIVRTGRRFAPPPL